MSNREFTDDYMESLLRDHFKAEVAERPASSNPWDWLKTRLESPSRQSRCSRTAGQRVLIHERDTQIL